ncbi:MAG: sugar ABC transporter permease [Rickettsiales bacterium]|nr:sugar ABC transporter permease [Rickettsiales bacterium]|tara:strand:- start:25320 stop:26147 length:828 start_codon:yes stop_codon:yes gene_type:complete
MHSRFYYINLFFITALIVIICLFPFYWAFVSSLKSGSALFTVDFWPKAPAWENYRLVFTEQPFGKNIFNSAKVALGTVVLCLSVAVFAAYSLGRIQFRGRKRILLLVLSISMFPQVAVLSGMFELISYLNLYNTVQGLILTYMTFTLPFNVWILTTFMRQLPKEIEEAAIIDGASNWTICTKILLPLLWPALVTTGLLAFIAAWNEFLFALTFTIDDSARTVPVAISSMSGKSEYELPWGNIMAASVIVTLPLIALVLIFQKRIVSGLTAGAIKG